MTESNVIYVAKHHWVIFFWPFILLCAALIIGIEIVVLKEVALLLVIVALIWLFLTWITYHYSSLIIKPGQISLHTGMLVRNTSDISAAKIESIDIQQTVIGSLFNYGSLKINGTGHTNYQFLFLSKPLTCRRYIEQLMQQR